MTTQRASDFIEQIAPLAQQVSEAYGIPASVIIAQAALETGWGQSVEGNNMFGIKATGGWRGDTVDFRTQEVLGGVRQNLTDTFRAYGSVGDSVRDYARLISGSSRYQGAMAVAGDAHAFAAELEEAGYATDPEYAEKLSRIIRSNNLTRFDNETYQARRTEDERGYDRETLREYDQELRRQREANPEPWEAFINNPLVQAVLGAIMAMFGLNQTETTRDAAASDTPNEQAPVTTRTATNTADQQASLAA